MAYFTSEKGTFLSKPACLPISTYRIINMASPYLYNNEDVILSELPNSIHKRTNLRMEIDSMEGQKEEYPHMSLSVAWGRDSA
jgi:hypothetical protein